jgi:hypothetical protein
MKDRCVCGCGRRAVHRHHVFLQQHIPPCTRHDARNLVPVAFDCHNAHHLRSRPLELRMLPDSVFAFGREVLGAGRAYERLRRYYAGGDPRLDALLEDVAA